MNKHPLYGTGNSTQQSVIIYMRKESKKEWNVYTYYGHTLLYT